MDPDKIAPADVPDSTTVPRRVQRVVARCWEDRPITEEVLRVAIERGEEGEVRPTVVGARVENGHLMLTFVTGAMVSIPLRLLPEFDELSSELQGQLEVGFVGQGLVVEAADLHVSVQGILEAAGVGRPVAK